MPLTLNQFLFLVLTFTAVIIAVFLVLFLAQLRKTAAEGGRALAEIKKLAENLNDLNKVIKDKMTDVGEIIEATKKGATHLSEATFLLTTRFLRPASRYWPVFYPLFRIIWRQFKKRKERKNGR